MQEIECSVSGKVQMVLFRDFVQRKARALGACGFVENLEDGSVRVVAQGEKETLEKLIEHLNKGPFLAQVAYVKVVWKEPGEHFVGFKIHY